MIAINYPNLIEDYTLVQGETYVIDGYSAMFDGTKLLWGGRA